MFRSTPSALAASPASTSTMGISTSPRKVVPLSTGEEWQNRPKPASTLTKRAFFCGVVVEGPDDGMDLSEEVQDLVASLGDRIPSDRGYEVGMDTSTSSQTSEVYTRSRTLTNTSALADLVNELLTTERNYVQRLRILKDAYADPLRSYARSKDTAIIPAYEAKILFGNVDQLLPANEAFLRELEQMAEPDGPNAVGGVGDIVLHHFKDLRSFECYKQYYAKREEAQVIFKREMAKKSTTGFAAFIERIKYSSNDPKNRVGLRELLMEPVQRIPRYTLLFRSMIKLMSPSDPQRAKLTEADEIASRIALAETDDHTRLAATLNCLAASIDGFPPALISSSRRFIDCIDVEDHVSDAIGMSTHGLTTSGSTSFNTGTPTGPNNGISLQCTLFLFDDKLMLVKRTVSDRSGRTLAGLDDIERFANGGFASGRARGLPGLRRGMLSCKGVLEVTEVVATDVTGSDLNLYLENPPLDQTERWIGRPFRILSVVTHGSSNQDPERAEAEKNRFLNNLWLMQARYRTKLGQSVALRGDDQEVESRGGRATVATTFFNVYQRTSFLKEARKTKVVLHIDSLGDADPLPFGLDGPPHVIIRVQPLPGDLCRYAVLSSAPEDEPDEDVVQTARVPGRVVHTIHQYGLFKFNTNNPSRPATPSGPNRSRAHVFGLDVLSRNLFGVASRNKDSSNGSTLNHRRSKSAISRTSTFRTDSTGTATTNDSSIKFSSRSNSTAATSVTSLNEGEESPIERSSRSQKPSRQSKSRSPTGRNALGGSSEDLGGMSLRRRALSLSVMQHDDRMDYSDHEEADMSTLDTTVDGDVSRSEMSLSLRLELARQNGRYQREQSQSTEEIAYEDDPPVPSHHLSRASRSTYASQDVEKDQSHRRSPSLRSTARSVTPTPTVDHEWSQRTASSPSRERRPMGPRSPSPLPPADSNVKSLQHDIDGLELYNPHDAHAAETAEPPTQLTRSKRQFFLANASTESTPKGSVASMNEMSSAAVEPLAIKKKTLVDSAESTPCRSPIKRSQARYSPLTTQEMVRQHEGSPSPALTRTDSYDSSTTGTPLPVDETLQKLVAFAETTKEDLDSSRRALKRIKLEVNNLPQRVTRGSPAPEQRSPTPSRAPTRLPVRTNAPPTREAQSRMEEMRSLIGQRNNFFAPPRIRPRGMSNSQASSPTPQADSTIDATELQAWTKSLDDLISTAELDLTKAAGSHETLQEALAHVISAQSEREMHHAGTISDLENATRQCERLQSLLSDATAENEMIFESFNEELDGMLNDMNLPTDEAWASMTLDLKKTKEERNMLMKENSELKRRLNENELQRDN